MSLAFAILFNILIFAASAFVTSLAIERYYRGTLKWIIVPSLTLSAAILMTRTGLMLRVLHSITKNFAIQDFGLILLGGAVTGIFFSFL